MGICIEQVSGRRALSEFITLPFRLYSDDPLWVAPLRPVQRQLLDPSAGHPFHEHAEVIHFLARGDGGRVAGRISAIVNRAHNEYAGDTTGFWGFLEAVNDPGVFAALFDAAGSWLSSRGMTAMRGPMNFSTNEEIGLLVKGFDRSPVLMMTYNPPWYQPAVEACGFEKVKDVLAYYLDTKNLDWTRMKRVSSIVLERTGAVIRPLRRHDLYEDVLVLMDIYNECWKRNWGFVPMTDGEFRQMAKDLGLLVVPEMGPIAYVDGQPVAFAVGLPDANQAFLKARGSALRAFLALKVPPFKVRIDGVRVLLLGVREKWRSCGLDALLMSHLIENGLKAGCAWGEFSWILEDNLPMRRILEKELSADPYKTYRIYERQL